MCSNTRDRLRLDVLSSQGNDGIRGSSQDLHIFGVSMRFRFSLRSLFIATTLAALACAWLVLPAVRARQFLRAMEQQDYVAADRMFIDGDDAFLSKWHERPSEYRLTARMADWTLLDLLMGRRPVRVMESKFLWENQEGKTIAVRSQGDFNATVLGIARGELVAIGHGN
jgi:hypothetical protein